MSVERETELPQPPQAASSSSTASGASTSSLLFPASLSVVIPFGVMAISFVFRLAAARITAALALGFLTLFGPFLGIALAAFALVRSRSRRPSAVIALAVLGLLLNVSFLVAIGYRAASLNTPDRRRPLSRQTLSLPTGRSSALTPVV